MRFISGHGDFRSKVHHIKTFGWLLETSLYILIGNDFTAGNYPSYKYFVLRALTLHCLESNFFAPDHIVSPVIGNDRSRSAFLMASPQLYEISIDFVWFSIIDLVYNDRVGNRLFQCFLKLPLRFLGEAKPPRVKFLELLEISSGIY